MEIFTNINKNIVKRIKEIIKSVESFIKTNGIFFKILIIFSIFQCFYSFLRKFVNFATFAMEFQALFLVQHFPTIFKNIFIIFTRFSIRFYDFFLTFLLKFQPILWKLKEFFMVFTILWRHDHFHNNILNNFFGNLYNFKDYCCFKFSIFMIFELKFKLFFTSFEDFNFSLIFDLQIWHFFHFWLSEFKIEVGLPITIKPRFWVFMVFKTKISKFWWIMSFDFKVTNKNCDFFMIFCKI